MEVLPGDMVLQLGDNMLLGDINLNITAEFQNAQRRGWNRPLLSIPFGYTPGGPRGKTYIRSRYQGAKAFGANRLLLAGKALAASTYARDYSKHVEMGIQVSAVALGEGGFALQLGPDEFADDLDNFTDNDHKKATSRFFIDMWNETQRIFGVRQAFSETRRRRDDETPEEYAASLISGIMGQIQEHYAGGEDVGTWGMIYGVWFNIVPQVIPRGFENVPSNEELAGFKKSQSVYFPPVDSMCFWWCMSTCLNDGQRVYSTQVKRDHKMICDKMGINSTDLVDMPFDVEYLRLVCYATEKDITVINKDRRILFQNNSERSLVEGLENDHILLFLFENYQEENDRYQAHWCWVRHFSSFVATTDCYICGTTFATPSSLARHLRDKKCLRCKCLKRGKTFNSVTAYKYHKDNLATECPVYKNTRNRELVRNGVPASFLKPTSAEKNDPMRLPDRMWSGDMESIVPFQQGGATPSTGKTHVPYAWAHYESVPIVDRPEHEHESIEHVERHELQMYYGPDCLEQFHLRLLEVKEEVKREALPCYHENIKRRLRGNTRAVQKFRSKIRGVVNDVFKNTNTWQPNHCPECSTQFSDKVQLREHLTGSASTAEVSECASLWYARRCLNYSFYPRHTFPARILPKIWIYCHNGAGYDFQFIMKMIRKHYRADQFEVLMSDTGRILGIELMGLFYFRDPVETLKGSLRSLAKSFRVEVQKGYFPYTAITMDDIHSVLGPDRIGPHHMHETEKVEGMPIKREFNAAEMDEFWSKWPAGFDVELATREYLADDVIALHQILCKVMVGWRLSVGTDFRDAMTAAGHAFRVYRNLLMPQDKYALVTPEENDAMRAAYQGGRTEVIVRGLTDAQRQAIVEGRAMLKYLDENGMYSAAHKLPHPTSHPTHIGPEEHPLMQRMLELGNPRVDIRTEDAMDAIRMHLNEHKGFGEEGFLHIAWVTLAPPSQLHLPVLPERRDNKTMFTLDAKTNYACCTPELELALRKGYEVVKVHYVMRFEAGFPFSDYVDHVIGKKIEAKQAGDAVLALIYKLLANSLYGRTGMGSKSRNVLVDSNARALKMLHEPGHSTSVKPFSRETNENGDVVDWALVTQTPIRSNNRTSNLSLASFTTSYARCMWYEMADRIETMKDRVEGVADSFVLYGDTDSVIAYFEYESPEVKLELTDNNGDPEDLGYLLDDLELGKWKDEFRDHSPPLDVVCVAPKLYFFKFEDGGEKGAAKGVQLPISFRPGEMQVNNEGFAQGINFETVRGLIRGEIRGVRTQAELWFTQSLTAVGTITSTRVLSGLYTKRVILEDGLQTRPLGIDDRCAFERAMQLDSLGYTGLEDLWIAVEEEEEEQRRQAAERAALPAPDEVMVQALGKRPFEELEGAEDQDDAALLRANLPPAARHMAIMDDEDMAELYELLDDIDDPMS